MTPRELRPRRGRGSVDPLGGLPGGGAEVAPEHRHAVTEGGHHRGHAGARPELERVRHERGRSCRVKRHGEHRRGVETEASRIVRVRGWRPHVHIGPGPCEPGERVGVSSRAGGEGVPAATGAAAESAAGF